MRVRFLLGPAGSGKTHRCLTDIREALVCDAEGPPLLLLAPKQSTFQLERRLLEDDSIAGWTRLQVLSFERLARFILDDAGQVDLLDEQGRVMVLRALLRWHQPRLSVFRSPARLTGFAQELSGTLRELRRQHLGPERLETLAGRLGQGGTLASKLGDLAVLLKAYEDWLSEHHLQDADLVPDLAVEALDQGRSSIAFGAVWLDGFAEMTPQEIDLLKAVVMRSGRATLAFCLENPIEAPTPWLSTWSVVGQTFQRCFSQLAAVPGVEIGIEVLARSAEVGRFRGAPALGHLEACWTRPREAIGKPWPGDSASRSLRLVECRDLESEAEVAAREVLRHVRAGGRFREVAVLVRSLEPVHAVLRRVFLRRGIPFFLDQRESMSHHPVAELTRCAVRLAGLGWQAEDWFGALKTGLTHASPDAIDELENEAIARGWTGPVWTRPPAELPMADPRRREEVHAWAGPFAALARALGTEPDGRRLATALRGLWSDLGVEATLNRWADDTNEQGPFYELYARLHGSAWEQIQGWLGSLELGLGSTSMSLTEWLPLIEAGLASLTAGVIPPAQDQVAIGAIDRSRQPELSLTVVLGLNEGVFPAPPVSRGLLTEDDRAQLAEAGVEWSPERLRRIGHERFLGYVACTRARERLVLTWSQRDDSGRRRSPSPFVSHVSGMFPDLAIESDAGDTLGPGLSPLEVLARVEHSSELLPWLLAQAATPAVDRLLEEASSWNETGGMRRDAPLSERLSPEWADALYGEEPEVSISALEIFAACPFQFLVRHGLRARERERFEVDRRRTGSLAHDLLARFHDLLAAERLRWRDLDPATARARFDEMARRHVSAFGGGVFVATPEARWQAEAVCTTLSEVVGVLVGWMTSYAFDPAFAELGFGGGSAVSGWCVPLTSGRRLRLRGKVDRVDVSRSREGGNLFAIIDYKLRERTLDDRLLLAGIDLQVAAYALALLDELAWPEVAGIPRPSLAGFFLVGLGSSTKRVESRRDLAPMAEALAEPHCHRGRLRASAATRLDLRPEGTASGQFSLRFKKDGDPVKGGDARLDCEFEAMLEEIRSVIRVLGEAMTEGDARVAPYRLGSRTACDRCDLRPVCRFDPWTQAYRHPGEMPCRGGGDADPGPGVRGPAPNPSGTPPGVDDPNPATLS